jgi:CO/xanthine dehydrogenase Mo-binding subunit
VSPTDPSLDGTWTRVEDERLVTGRGCFVADLREPGCAEAAFVRSDTPHGRLRAVALDAARRTPGVLAAWAAADLPAAGGDVPLVPGPMVPAAADHPWPALATDRVRYPGQPVAVVAADYAHPPLVHTSLEPRAVLVRPERDDGLTVWCSHQAPHRLREPLTSNLRRCTGYESIRRAVLRAATERRQR